MNNPTPHAPKEHLWFPPNKLCLAFTFCTILLSATAGMDQPLMRWGDPVSGCGLKVYGSGQDKWGGTWCVREQRLEDTPFFQKVYADPEVMKYFGPGKTYPAEQITTWIGESVKAFAQGYPSNVMTVVDQDDAPMGGVALWSGTKPGVGELCRLFGASAQGKGLGTATLKFLVNIWAPAVRQIGLGKGENSNPAIEEKFKCYKGEALRLIYTTARPSNPASWACYKHVGFYPSPPTDTSYTISCENWEFSQHGSLEDYINTKHFTLTSADPLSVDVLYPMVDEKASPRTISFKQEFGSLRYHFEREVI